MALQFNEELLAAVRAGLCNTTSLAQRTAELGQGFWNSVGLRGAGQTSSQAAQMWGNAAGLACNREPQDIEDAIAPPFSGGQCPGVFYRVITTNAPNPPFNPAQSTSGPGVGPLSYVTDNGPGFSSAGIVDANGNAIAGGSYDGSNGPVVVTVIDVQRLDGQPDDCGDAPVSVDPYDPANFTVSPPVTFTDENGTDVTINPTIVYSPITTNEGNEFSAPFEITFEDGSSLFGDFNLSTGDINIGPGNSGGGGAAGPEREKDPDEPLEEGEEIIGVRVVSAFATLSGARLTEIATVGNAPNLYVPRLATVLFRRETAVGNGWSQPYDVQTTDAVIYSDVVSIDAAVTFRPGVTGSYKLVLRSANSA